MDYEKDVKIHPDDLDLDCLEQPSLMRKYAAHEARLEKDVANAEEALSYCEAQLDRDVRENPTKHLGDLKVTENAIRNVIQMHDDYIAAKQDLIEARYELKVVRGVVKAVDHRKSMLETLTKLHGQNYFAGPNVPHDLVARNEKRENERKKSMSGKLNRRRKTDEQNS